MTLARFRWCLLLLAALLAASPGEPPTRRIVVIGASVSDGFGVRLRTRQPDGSQPVMPVTLATLLRAAAKAPEVEVRTHATSMFFSNPEAFAKTSVERAVQDRPTLVLAIDWIFWSAYGWRGVEGKPMKACDDRRALLESGLKALEPLAATGVPIVLGDLPDMRQAIEGGMLTEAMVPDAACLAQLNARLKAWVDAHPSVMLLDLSDVVRRTLADQPVRACNRDWCVTDLGPMLQKDRLHPTLNGTLAVVAAALDAADHRTGGACSKAFDLDPATIRARLAPLARQAQAEAAPPPTTSATAPAPPAAAGSSSRPSP